MFEEAYRALHDLENDHWWYIGARVVYRTLMEIGLGRPQGGCRLLEVGSGSGGNLPLLGMWGPTLGAELSPLALALTPKKPALGLVLASADHLPLRDGAFDGVALLGVIEHLDNDLAALREARRVCRLDGAVILLTSAVPALWSHHDEANRHRRRYWRTELKEKLAQTDLYPIRLSYQNFFTFFPTLAVRLWQRRNPQPPRYDMSMPPRPVNALLSALLRLEAWFIRFFPLPIGVDLVAVCRPDIPFADVRDSKPGRSAPSN